MATSSNDPVVLLGAGHAEALGLLESEAPEGRRAVRVEADGLEPAEFAAAVLRRLRIESEAQDPWRRFEEAVRDLGNDGLLLLVSGASGMLSSTAAELRRWIDRLAGNLHVVLAMGPPNEALLAELAPISAEIQVGVLGPKPAAVRARRLLGEPPRGERSTGAVTMAQLAKARRRRTPGPEQGLTPGRAPGEPEPRPVHTPEKSGLPPLNAPFPADEDVRWPARELHPRREPSATNSDEETPVPRVAWRRAFMSIAATLMVIGAVWWALAPEPYVDRAGDREPVRSEVSQEPQIQEGLPQVSVGPPQTEPVPKPAPSPGAGAVLPRPVPEKTAEPTSENQVRDEKTPAIQAASLLIVEDSVEPEPGQQPLPAAPMVASGAPGSASQPPPPEAHASEPLAGTRSEYVPPIVHDPKRVPEILRIGPPSSAAVAASADGPGSPGAVDADLLAVTIDAEPVARIHVDGRLLGQTPIADARLREGLHSFSIEFENGQVSERSVRVDTANQSFLFRLVPTGSRSPPRPGD
ncbi:MAG: hypothetical protein GY937_18075 [bacterium]|nr:hypothetical protein [bacterium]